jgi:hypothetical protein
MHYQNGTLYILQWVIATLHQGVLFIRVTQFAGNAVVPSAPFRDITALFF